jgi:hypothetical protein
MNLDITWCSNPNAEMELCMVCERNPQRLEGMIIEKQLSYQEFKPEPATINTDEKCLRWLYHPIYKD